MAFLDQAIGIIGNLKTDVRVTRGLRQLDLAASFEPHRLAFTTAVLRILPTVRAGEETVLELSSARIPRHAEILEIAASLKLTPGQAQQVTQSATVNGKSFATNLTLPEKPSSLTLGLEGGDVIWTWSGRPGQVEFTIPDFSEQANAFLEAVASEGGEPGDGLVSLRFTLLSDVDASVDLRIPEEDLEYRLLQPQGWDSELDDTLHMDRNLELGFGHIIDVPLDPIVAEGRDETVPVEELRLDVGGELGPERLLGQVVPAATREFATVGRGFSVAQEVRLPDGLPSAECVGVALGLATDVEGEIYFELRPDAGGSPADAAPIASGTAPVPVPDPPGRPAWVTGRFKEPAVLTSDAAPYWLILKEIRGVVRLGLDESDGGYLGRFVMNRGGQFWHGIHRRDRPPGSAHALLRLVYLPTPDTRSAAVELVAQLIGGSEQAAGIKVDPTAEGELFHLRFPAGARARGMRLSVRSHAEGDLSLANVVQVYRPS